MRKWSKLQKELYAVLDRSIDLQIHCSIYRMKSQYGSTDLPRYFITLGKEIIFDYPNQFDRGGYPYITEVSDISNLIRDYIDTPKEELLQKTFNVDKWQLSEILKAADKRIGQRRLHELYLRTDSIAARKIIALRCKTQLHNEEMPNETDLSFVGQYTNEEKAYKVYVSNVAKPLFHIHIIKENAERKNIFWIDSRLLR